MTVLLFEDPAVCNLYPVTVARPAFTINCGSYRLLDQVRALDLPVRAIARPHLRASLAADLSDLVDPLPSGGAKLLVNARVVPSVAARRQLERLLSAGASGVVHTGGTIAAALLPESAEVPGPFTSIEALESYLYGLPLAALAAELPLLEYPHDILRHHLQNLGDGLEQRLREGEYREIADGVLAADGAVLGEHVVADTTRGPILLEAGASVGPFCYLQGPIHVGPRARVLEHAAIKDHVALGHTTKIGGELEASIVESYTNKQHHGFLGHSYLGSWINMGAGTCNSDLKNTYGEVKMEYHGRKVATGMQFVGAIVGDYAKTAINTGIFTGKTIGVCSMVYGFVTTNVPSFVNYARLFGQVTAAPVEVMVATQARMFARREVAQRSCDIQLLHDMYELTRHERELGSVPPEPLSF